MTHALGRSLLLVDALSPDALGRALFVATTEGVSLVRALRLTGVIDPTRLEEELARAVDAPEHAHVVPDRALMDRLPPMLCARLLAVPVALDVQTGVVDVAVADARDSHSADEIAFFLGAPVRLVRASLTSIEAALGMNATPPPARMRALAPPWTSPSSSPSGPRTWATTPLWGTPTVALPTDAVPAAESEDEMAQLSRLDPDVVAHDPLANPDPRAASDAASTEGASDESLDAAEIPIPLSRRALTRDLAPRESGIVGTIANDGEPGTLLAWDPTVNAYELDETDFEPADPEADDLDAAEDGEPSVEAADAASDDPDIDENGEPIVELRRSKPAPRPSTRARASMSFDAILRELADVSDRDRVLSLMLLGAERFTRKAAIFAVKRDHFAGWTCTPAFGDRRSLQRVRIEGRGPSVFAHAAAGGSYAGPLLRNDANAPVLSFFEPHVPQVACAAVRVGGRPALVLLAHELGDPIDAMKPLADLARAAGEALERILRSKP